MFARDHSPSILLPQQGKNIVLMSTLHKNAEISPREDQKPTTIKSMVDNLDKLNGSYSTKGVNARFYNMLDVSVYNAFVIWTGILPDWNMSKLYKRHIFLEELRNLLHRTSKRGSTYQGPQLLQP